MGQSLSRRRLVATPVPASPVPGPGQPNDTLSPRRSLPNRILSSIRKPSLRSRSLPSLTLPNRTEQTLRGKNRRWRLSRRRNVAANTDATLPERMAPLTEHDDQQVDRDVDEFGVIAHRVHDNHSDSPAASAKGKQKAKDAPRIANDNESNDDAPVPSTSTASLLAQSGAGREPVGDDEVVSVPTVPPSPSPPSQPPPRPPAQQSERPSVLLASAPTHPSPSPSAPQPSSQQTNTPRSFPPPGTLVVVQGVVHTTDVPRSSDRPVTTSNPIPPTINNALHSSIDTNQDRNSIRPSSVPPESRLRNPLSGILPRPTSMTPAVPSTPEPIIGSPNIDAQTRRFMSNTSGAVEDIEDGDRTHTHPHGISMTQGPVGASGLSASSINVLGTLLSVAAAATAASLLTGSSEPIFSSGLTSQPPPPSNSVSPSASLNSNIPTERPLSPTPTSDAGRMRHVWSSLRDRLGLGGSNSNHTGDPASGFGLGQNMPSHPADVLRPRDPREIMLAEMARAFNLGLGLGGTTTNTPSTTSANTAELAMPAGDVLVSDGDGDQSSLPPPDSFERFLMDLQSDLRVTLMQEGVAGGTTPDAEGNAENAEEAAQNLEEDHPIPELQSLSDSDSEEFGTRNFESDEEDELEDDIDNEFDEEDVHTALEQLSGRTSPAVSALGTGTRYPFGPITDFGTTSGMSLPHTAIPPGADAGMGASNSALNVAHSSPAGKATRVLTDGPSPSAVGTTRVPESEGERAVLGVTHSPETSIGRPGIEAEGCNTISRPIAVQPLDAQDPSNEATTRQDSSLPGTSSSSVPLTSNVPSSVPENAALASQVPPRPVTSSPEPTTQASSSTNPNSGDSPMPFRFPFTPNPASRTERTPGGGINWWRMYRFPAIASPNPGQQGPQGSAPLSQPASRIPEQGPSHVHGSPWTRSSGQNEMPTPRGAAVSAARSGLTQPSISPSVVTPTMPETVSAPSQSIIPPLPTNGQDSSSPANATSNPSEQRNNVVVPVIVVGLQSVNVDRQPPHMPQPQANPTTAVDDEDGDGMEFDGLEQPMSLPLQIPEPAEFRRTSNPSNTMPQEQNIQQPARGRTWQSRAANAFRNLRPSRRNADAASPQPQEATGSRTFLIYVIGGYYPPDHQIITGGNLDSFEALWELAELLGQVKPPTVSKDEIENSGLEIIKASVVEEYEKQGRVASNCIDKCLICLDDYDPEDDLRVLSCKHTFHQGCVDRWLETGRNNCPACRSKGVGNENTGSTSATSA